MPELPFGRGYRLGQDASVNQSESWDARARAMASKDAWFLAPDNNVAANVYSMTGHQQVIVFAILPMLSTGLEAEYARIRITTPSLNSFVRSCLYRYDAENGLQRFVKVPSSEALFSGTSAGVKTVRLADTATINANEAYFLATYVSDSSVAVTCDRFTGSRIMTAKVLNQTLGSSSERLPSTIAASALASNTTTLIPFLVYMSRTAADVFD